MNTTIEQCLDSLDYYLNNWGFQHKTIAPLVYGIHLKVERATYPEELMIKCLGKVIKAIDYGTKFNYVREPFLTLTDLIDEHRLQRITPSQRLSLARYLLAKQPRGEGVLQYYFRLFQRCFTSDAFLASNYINYSMVCSKAIDYVFREISGGGFHRQDALEMGVSILSKCLCKISRSDETLLKKRFDCLFNYLMTGFNQRSRQAAVAILVHVFSFSTNRNMTEDEKSNLTTEIISCFHGYRRNSIDIWNVHCFIQTSCKSSAVKDWIDWVMMNMSGDKSY
ncbi:hypothetical protein CRE_22680 [Caenorhabditis remanei]|uniref:Uncharacterized protein n=1 Tax=Caenorhabditis remanei TaxID=31234 RepID=E3NFJ3_CAERE|nr:hypothetical protein CRE_22680 [Caenorhabditis remanei]